MFIFAIAVWFTSHAIGVKGLGSPSRPSWGLASFLFNEGGTEKKIFKADRLFISHIMGY